MKIFQAAIPIIRGFAVYEIAANNEEEAKKLLLSGEGDNNGPIEYDNIELDFDENLMEIEEII